ncbi:aryl hydrocarbon receptor protein 1 isoform X3 [Contarinia nasturtii]|uniref:aryl hydrocarbon receptor protein 1 isoform X3 n=1 Tax=Contarinia nasturtii TaxID=265458 RepID=UPI0012D465C9|nr:aryl hydrocarbon receptor protein 1 isoform X3 [Contarinia nasturtii]
MSQLSTVYATKRRRRNGKSLKPPPKDGVTKSNPSKRHRERLNAELDLLASLLPFEQNILSKLDRLSILRLAVSYLRTKSYFQVVMLEEKEENGLLSHIHHHDVYRSRELNAFEHSISDGDMFLQALNGFLMILTCDGEVFFATHSIESYLGFHQSDIVHQSVYELVHSEDREELQRQLLWNSFLPSDAAGMPLNEALSPDKSVYLERSFTVRFRCLLDNTSGFLRLDIRGRVKILHGQNRKTEEPPLGLFAYCTPFGPPSLMEIPQKENMFKSKHKLDLSLVSMDQRGKMILGYADNELATMGGYSLVHFDDLAYVASAHQELLKTGASGMIAYRYQKKDGEWQWLQTSSRLVYKNSKPDFVISTHRQLMEEEGKDLLGKRTMDFKVSYLDTGLASTYFSEADQLIMPPSGSPNSLSQPSVAPPQRPSRRYKTQLRDFLSTCRSKRKVQQSQPQHQSSSHMGQITPPAPEYIPVAAAYTNLNPMYAAASPYPSSTENLYMTPSGGYYSGDYHHSSVPTSYVANGFLPYDGYAISTKEEKWQDNGKYYDVTSRSSMYTEYSSPTGHSQIIQSTLKTPKTSPPIMESPGNRSPSHNNTANDNNDAGVLTSNNVTNSSNANVTNGSNSNNSTTLLVTPKIEPSPPSSEHYERQTVLMWGTSSTNRSPITTPTTNGLYSTEINHLKRTNQIVSPTQDGTGVHMKWSEGTSNNKEIPVSVPLYQIHSHQTQTASAAVDASTMYAHVAHSSHLTPHHSSSSTSSGSHIVSPEHGSATPTQNHQHVTHQSLGSSCEVGSWSPAYSQYQYFTYHPAPQHANTQSSLVDTNQSHCPSRSNGYMDHPTVHHHHHQQHGTISPISQLTQLSHTQFHPTRTSITRTGVLCCPASLR